MRKIFIYITLFFSTLSFSQTGTMSDPFVSLNQSIYAPSAGIYHFNISGNAFSTYIDANGYVLVLTDFGNGSGNLTDASSLTNTARGKLSSTILASLTETAEVRVTSSDGAVDVVNTNATIISRVRSNTTIHRGSVDTTINKTWVGTGSAYLTASCDCTHNTYGSTLNSNVFWLCGALHGFHIIPQGGYQRIDWNNGEVASTVALSVWVKGVFPLPVQMGNFFGEKALENNLLKWSTLSERNSDYFEIVHSTDLKTWDTLGNVKATGSAEESFYEMVHTKPERGLNYYKLIQHDLNGEIYDYGLVFIDNSPNEVILYPNPAKNSLKFSKNVSNVTVLDTYGRVVLHIIEQNLSYINLEALEAGKYFIQYNFDNALNRSSFIKQ